MSDPSPQDEAEDQEAMPEGEMPAPEELERQSDMAVVESDDDWED